VSLCVCVCVMLPIAPQRRTLGYKLGSGSISRHVASHIGSTVFCKHKKQSKNHIHNHDLCVVDVRHVAQWLPFFVGTKKETKLDAYTILLYIIRGFGTR